MQRVFTARSDALFSVAWVVIALVSSAPDANSALMGVHPTSAQGGLAEGTGSHSFFSDLLKSYTPREACMHHEQPLIWLHFLSDLLIAIAYFTIPVALLRFVRRRRDVEFHWIFVFFAAFILACGLTHVMNIVALGNAMYRLDGLVKAITAVASIVTAIALWRLLPAAIALPSPTQLRTANVRLEEEVQERKQAESRLLEIQSKLEERVQERTLELTRANEILGREIEARKDAELARARLAAIVESSEDAIVGKDLDGTVTSWNDGARRMFGWAGSEIIGRPVALLRPPELHDEEVDRLQRVQRGERVEQYESVRVAKDGRLLDVSVSISPIRGVAGEIIGTSKIVRDVSARKQIEREREALLVGERTARAEAEAANRMKDEFLATISHELRTPLNSILGWSHMLLKDASGEFPGQKRLAPSDVEVGLGTIERNARLQAQLIEDLLDMSRIISGKVRLDVQRVELQSVIEAAMETVRPAFEAKEIRVQTLLDPRASAVHGDPGRLQQVLWNLLSNAVKFTPKGGRIQVALQRVNSQIEITVTDTGVGIEPDFLPYVFDRFRQADASTTRRHGGLGLGLSIVRSLVEMHGGTVTAKSQGVDKGSTFAVELPLVALHDDELGRRHPHALGRAVPKTESVALDGVRVLVVDDELDARRLVQRVLEANGAVVETAGSAQEGLRAIQRTRPDVILSDIGMPEEDGYEFIRRVRASKSGNEREIPAIAITAFARSEDRTRALLAGFKSHIVKPVDPAELIAVVASVSGRTL